MQEVETIDVIAGINKSWNYLQKFMQNVYPDFTKSFQETLDVNEILITKDMVNEAYSIFKK